MPFSPCAPEMLVTTTTIIPDKQLTVSGGWSYNPKQVDDISLSDNRWPTSQNVMDPNLSKGEKERVPS